MLKKELIGIHDETGSAIFRKPRGGRTGGQHAALFGHKSVF
jgi:hypothetical protein